MKGANLQEAFFDNTPKKKYIYHNPSDYDLYSIKNPYYSNNKSLNYGPAPTSFNSPNNFNNTPNNSPNNLYNNSPNNSPNNPPNNPQNNPQNNPPNNSTNNSQNNSQNNSHENYIKHIISCKHCKKKLEHLFNYEKKSSNKSKTQYGGSNNLIDNKLFINIILGLIIIILFNS